MKYGYILNPKREPEKNKYTYEDLKNLTTLQLREICKREKIVVGSAFKLDRQYMIDAVLKYRGNGSNIYINKYNENNHHYFISETVKYFEFTDINKEVSLPERITLNVDFDLTENDGCVIEGKCLEKGNVILFDEKKNIQGILNLVKKKDKFYLIYNHKLLNRDFDNDVYKNYSLGFIDEKTSAKLYDIYYKKSKLKPSKFICRVKSVNEIAIERAYNNDNTLVIDFGTSNSAVGVFVNKSVGNIKFSDNEERGNVLPTVVSIKDCSDPEKIKFRFGYDALSSLRKNSFNYNADIFFNLKSWVNDYEKTEEVSDEYGNTAVISRKKIIREYFKYIIFCAERQYKCRFSKLHITSPVKQKRQFIDMYKNIFDGKYIISDEEALDEGIAVLYNSISNIIEKRNFKERETYKALIIDCGGGTTDLTSCSFSIEDNGITYKLNISNMYANGETNFGGNNITYRIFQYIKILFAYAYKNKIRLYAEELLEIGDTNIYDAVDSEGYISLYEKFNSIYEKCERIIPTQYFMYKNKSAEMYKRVRNNFYFIWNLAETIKIVFYGVTSTSGFDFNKINTDSGGKIKAEESWRLNIMKNGAIELETSPPDITISKEEINLIIKGDIYNVIKKFIEPLYNDGRLYDFNFIKLTGQTCKIDLFRDALKEFIPGKIIETSRKGKTANEFKLTCVEGAVKYENDRKTGLIGAEIINQVPIATYKLTAFNYKNEEITLISGVDKITKTYGFISKNINTEETELFLKDSDNNIIHTYTLNIKADNFSLSSYEEINTEYADRILQDDIDDISDNEIKIFTFAYKDKWGFYVLPVLRKEQKLYIGSKKYYPFEHDEWERNFFDGRK